jgi:primosomal protein N' (replication factor Y) (superfamily II helicase)
MSSSDRIISVAIPRPLHHSFTYLLPAEWVDRAQVGAWVKVPFGRSEVIGFILAPPQDLSELPPGLSLESLKSVIEVGKSEEALPRDVMALCRWASEYYASPLGEVLSAAAPHLHSGARKLKKPPRSQARSQSEAQRKNLTHDQAQAVSALDQYRLSSPGKVALVHGVTGSGKTEVYIELARRVLAEGRGVILLVPEIALTPQLHQRFIEGLGCDVAIWHSAVSDGKRRDQTFSLLRGDVKVVVGARSAVFAPVQNLGLIVIDEEHDATYKQEERLRYHARDLAVVRAKQAQAFAVLGSATPSLESQERVREGKYFQVNLPRRVFQGGMPQIQWVDLKTAELVPELQAPLAVETIEKIKSVIASGEQVLIYLNRRGFASFLICKDCGDVYHCPDCSISLTLHKGQAYLKCHLCGHQSRIPDSCAKCQGMNLFAMGAGTESLESELPGLLPGVRVIRLDRDQVTSTKRLDEVLSQFKNREADLLIGTQMLVKGHDFPGVTLVVVVLADALFRWPDYRATERAYQVLKQVSGRAGRGDKPGLVMVQTYDTEHTVLQVLDGRLSEQDFMTSELELRKVLHYPPFGRIARLRLESLNKAEAFQKLGDCVQLLSQHLQGKAVEFLGPSEAFIERVKGYYRWDVLVKAREIQELQRVIQLTKWFSEQNKLNILIDIDPYGL